MPKIAIWIMELRENLGGHYGINEPLWGKEELESCAMNQKNVCMGGHSITNIDPKDGNHGIFQAISTFIIQLPFYNGQFFCSLM